MTVRELIELNAMITDLQIEVRHEGNLLFDELNIGLNVGRKPPFPVRVPIKYDVNLAKGCRSSKFFRDAAYIQKSINSFDDGREYWEVKPNRIPKGWLDLEVFSWEVWQASRVGCPGRQNNNFYGQRLNIVALPSGQTLSRPKQEQKENEYDGQMSIEDWNINVITI